VEKSEIELIAYKLHKIKYKETNTFIKRVFSESMCFLVLMVATYFVTFDSAAKEDIGQHIFVVSVIIYIIY